jgi:pilus assembly protein FimV
LQELSAFVDTNLPAEEKAKADEASGEFNIDSLDIGDDAGLGEVSIEGGDAGSEIDTKLDLARAYIDMGDPDGAKNILDEVVQDGNEQQQAEARKLLAQIK